MTDRNPKRNEISVELIDSGDIFLGLKEEWDYLLQHSSANTIFLTWEWISAWWKNYKKDYWELYILLFREGEKLVGIAPLYRTRAKTSLVVQIKKLLLLGYGSFDSEYLDIISCHGKEKEVLESLINYLDKNKNEWDVFILNEVPESSATLNLLRTNCDKSRYLVSTKKHDCAFVKLPGSWDEYLASMHYNFRKKLRHFTKRLENSHTVEFSEFPVETELEKELESFFDLHQKHWESEDMEGSFADVQRRNFYYDMAKLFLKKGWLRLYSLKVDGRFAAHQYCFEYDNKIFSLQDGFDPDWGMKRVARVLRGYVFKDIIGRGLKEYDFLGELSPYKKNWVAVEKFSVNTIIAKKNYKSFLFLTVPSAFKAFRKSVKDILPQKLVNWRNELSEKNRRKKTRKKIDQRNASVKIPD